MKHRPSFSNEIDEMDGEIASEIFKEDKKPPHY